MFRHGPEGLRLRHFDDDWELLPGDSIVERVGAAISKTDVLLVLLSRNSVDSQWVRRELSAPWLGNSLGRGCW